MEHSFARKIGLTLAPHAYYEQFSRGTVVAKRMARTEGMNTWEALGASH